MPPADVLDALERHLGHPIGSVTPVGGGCISHASRVQTREQAYFLKWSDDEPGDTFASEAQGLAALKSARHPLRIPRVVFMQPRSQKQPGILLLEWIDQGSSERSFWSRFGADLAELHRNTSEQYGFDADNYIGRLPQCNAWREQWPDFFADNRLEAQAAELRRRGAWVPRWTDAYDRLLSVIEEVLPRHTEPSLVHGDLWSGNFMPDRSGAAVLVDPAVYYGHREVDIAMTELFGGFDAAFYGSYGEAWPLEPGYEERREVYNLYHLMNHVNHFGASYASSVTRILDRFR